MQISQGIENTVQSVWLVQEVRDSFRQGDTWEKTWVKWVGYHYAARIYWLNSISYLKASVCLELGCGWAGPQDLAQCLLAKLDMMVGFSSVSLRELLAGLSSSQSVGQKVSAPASALCRIGLPTGEQLTNGKLLCESKQAVPKRVSERPSVRPSQPSIP